MKARSVLRCAFALIATVIGIALATGTASAAPYGDTNPQIGVIDPGPCAGTYLTTTGSGFQPGETVVISRDGTVVGQVTAGPDGTFSEQLSLASVAPGTHSVSATGTVTNETATSSFSVQSEGCSDGAQTVTAISTNTASAGLAFTGVQAAAIGGFGAIVLVGGLVLIVLGRRRA